MRLILSILILSLAFGNSAYALTLNKSAYFDNEPVIVTAITNGTWNNLWLYPYTLAANCRYYGTYNCATGNSTQAVDLPTPLQDDSADSPAEQTFGTAVILGNGTFYVVETSNTQDCGGLTQVQCEGSAGYVETETFTMASSGAATATAAAIFQTDLNVLNELVDNSMWAVLIGLLIGTAILAIRGRKTTQTI